MLARATREAIEAGLRPVALTFDPPPAVVLGRGPAALLTTTKRKVQLIGRVVPELQVIVKTFDRAFADMSPADFAREILVGEFGAVRVVVGQNFRFGHGRAGDRQSLNDLGTALGFVAEAAEIVGDERGPWSSSRVRASIAADDWDDVNHVLGRPHALTGVVVPGDARGRTMGVPTANLAHIEELLPPFGVFAVLVDEIDTAGAASALAAGVANVGVRPTVGAGPSVEAHLFDFAGDLYGRTLRVHLVSRLRGEHRFDGLDALKHQIAKDQVAARSLLAAFRPPPDGTGWF